MAKLIKVGNSWLSPDSIVCIEPFEKRGKKAVVVHTDSTATEIECHNDSDLDSEVSTIACYINDHREG